MKERRCVHHILESFLFWSPGGRIRHRWPGKWLYTNLLSPRCSYYQFDALDSLKACNSVCTAHHCPLPHHHGSDITAQHHSLLLHINNALLPLPSWTEWVKFCYSLVLCSDQNTPMLAGTQDFYPLPVSRRVFTCWYLGFCGILLVKNCLKEKKNVLHYTQQINTKVLNGEISAHRKDNT